MMAEAFVDVEVEPKLQEIGEECLPGSANRSEEARLDVRVRGFWVEAMQEAFFDIRVFIPLLPHIATLPYKNSIASMRDRRSGSMVTECDRRN